MRKIINRIERLEIEIEFLDSKIEMVNDYAEFIYTNTFTTLSLVIGIVSVVLLGSLFFLVRYTVNQKVESEIEKRVLKTMSENPPIYIYKGENQPNDAGIIQLDENINGIDELNPKSLIHIAAYPEHAVWGQIGNSLNPKIQINKDGIREITLNEYVETNGIISWVIIWVRNIY